MACNTSSYNIGIHNVFLGKDTYQEFCITTKADVASSLNNKYFVIHEPVTQAKHYFWFNVASGGVDPAVPNATGHAIAIAANASASAVATATASIVGALTWINATASAEHIECVMTAYGYAYEARNALDVTDSPKFTITVAKFGSVQQDLGATSDDGVTVAQEISTIEVTSPQTGDFVLAEIRKGVKATVSFSLKDTSDASMRRAFNMYGGTVVTDDAASSVLTGYGAKNLFKSTEDMATQLVLRPSANVENVDASEDLTMPKAFIKLGEMTLNGDEQLLPMEATAYLDSSKSSYVNFMVYGDGSAIPNA